MFEQLRLLFSDKMDSQSLATVVLVGHPDLRRTLHLTIDEAFMAGTPVIVSNLGGMAELVRGGGGLTFEPGDPGGLAAVLAEVLHNPARLNKLRSSIPKVKTIADNAEEAVLWYKKFLQNGQ